MQWVWWKTIDDWCTQSIHTSVVLLRGSFEGCPAHLRGAGVWKASVGMQHGNSAILKRSFHQHYIIPCTFLQPHQTVLRRGLFTVKGSRWTPLGLGCPGTWSPSLHVYWHLWTKHLPETRCDDQSSKDAQLQHSSLKATVCLQRNNVFRSSVNPSWCHDIKLWYVDYCTEVCHYGHHYFVYCWQNWPYLDDREEPGRLYLLDLSMNVKTCCRREFLITR